MLGALVHCIAAWKRKESALERKRQNSAVVTRFAPSPDRLPAYRRRPHRAVQLALRPPPRRQVPAAHRGHRQGALDHGGDRRDPRRDALARPRLGRPRILPVAILGAARRGRAQAARARRRLPLLHDARRSWPRSARRRPSAAVPDRQPVARPHRASRADKPVRHPPEGAARGRDGHRRPVQGRVTVQNAELDDFILLRSDGTPDLHAGGGRRRPRHGRHPRHPRRRPSSTTPSASWRSSARWAGRSRPTPTCR